MIALCCRREWEPHSELVFTEVTAGGRGEGHDASALTPVSEFLLHQFSGAVDTHVGDPTVVWLRLVLVDDFV